MGYLHTKIFICVTEGDLVAIQVFVMVIAHVCELGQRMFSAYLFIQRIRKHSLCLNTGMFYFLTGHLTNLLVILATITCQIQIK